MVRDKKSSGDTQQPATNFSRVKHALGKKLHKAKVVIGSLIVGVGVTISVVAMFVPVNILHPADLWRSFHSLFSIAATTAAAEPVETPKTCDVKNTVDTTTFAECPSYVLDYSSARNGSISSNTLNVAVGHPSANNEAQTYTTSTQNLRIENGALVLEARNGSAQAAHYTSAKVDTKGKQDFMYGKIVVQAQTPTGVGTWPAIWMLPSSPRYANLGDMPSKYRYLNDGEIDILEAIGSQPNTIYSVAHTLTYDNNGVDHTYFNTVEVPGSNTGFQTYELDWTPTSLTFKVNDQTYFSYTKPANADYKTWPYDQKFYLIMNLALGGNWAGQDRTDFPHDGIDTNALPTSLKIKSVRYYSYIGPQ